VHAILMVAPSACIYDTGDDRKFVHERAIISNIRGSAWPFERPGLVM